MRESCSAAIAFTIAVGCICAAADPPAKPYKGKVFLGLGTQSVKLPEDGRYKSKYGLEVVRVAAGSSAEQADIRVGDTIVSIDNAKWSSERIRLSRSFGKAGNKARPGDVARFVILRTTSADPKAPKSLITKDVVLTPYPGTAPEKPGAPTNDAIRPDLKNHHPAYETLCWKLVEACGYREQTLDLLARLDRAQQRPDPFRLPIMRYVHRDPFKLEVVSREIVHPLLQREALGVSDIPLCLERTRHLLLRFETAKHNLPWTSVAPFKRLPPYRGKDLKGHLDYVQAVLATAAANQERAFSTLTKDEIKFIRDHRQGILDAFIFHHMLSYDTDHERQRRNIQLLRLARKVNVSFLISQAEVAYRLVAPEFTLSLRQAALAMGKAVDQPVVAERKTPHGVILVAGTGRTRYQRRRGGKGDYAAIYELGGDDVYANNCAASVWGEIPTAVIVDYAGDDAYESTDAFRQGCGDMGTGILVDLAGDDNYVGRRFCQGTGFMGVGVLVDASGNDTYRGIEYSQAVGHWGAGLLIDSRGRDRYEAHDASQAVGLSGGVGLLCDAGPEGDSYYCKGRNPTGYGTPGVFEGWGQGCGMGYRPYASGGVAVLLDRGGSDRFEAGNFSQGGGYFYAFGLMYMAGKEPDVYIGSRYAQGFACHQAAGAFIEEGGDDRYQTRNAVAQGLSWDETSGLFIDEGGDDRYEGGGFSHGASANNGFIIFLDRAGKDTYLYTDQARAGGNSYHGGHSLSLFLDLGGDEDSYPRRPNNAIQHGKENSLFCDLPAGLPDALKGDAWRKLLPKAKPAK